MWFIKVSILKGYFLFFETELVTTWFKFSFQERNLSNFDFLPAKANFSWHKINFCSTQAAYTAQKMKISLIDIFFVRCSNRNSVPVPYLWSEHESDSPSSWLPWKEYFFLIYMDTIKCPIKFNELYRCLTILLLQFSSIYMQLC